ncbi:hypothetical protein SELMODRAFT_72540, partial [Selaginella moellendorffii]
DPMLSNALIAMFRRCGSVADSHKIFSRMEHRGVVSWNSMLAVCSGDETLEFFGRMAQAGFTPSEVSFVSVLAACSHKGDVELGRSYFVGMWTDFGIEATVDHYACFIDVLGRAGELAAADGLVASMPFEPDSVLW